MNPLRIISEAVENIKQNEAKRVDAVKEILAKKYSKIDFDTGSKNCLLEDKLVFPIAEHTLNSRIAAVDSGFVGKNLYSFDLLFIRTAGVLFTYKNNILERAAYYPEMFSFPKPIFINGALQLDESSVSRSLYRLFEEIGLAKEIIEKEKPEYCLIDGSIIPQHADKPRKDSKVTNSYSKVISLFESLYKAAEDNGTILIGCIEDSRGSRFREIIQQNFVSELNKPRLDDCYDSVLLDSLLKEKERTSAFHYTNNIEMHPILSDFNEKYSKAVNVCYLKPSKYDRALRIEFLSNERNEKLTEFVDKISPVICQLSSLHREYAFPSPLIEADLRAGLNPDEIEFVFNKIADKLGNNFRLMRRDSRPF
ncbi:MAG: DNA double-strand break repair nuclease NurA [archaeon]